MNALKNRRAFLKDALRVLAAAVLAWFGLRLAARRSDPHTCINEGLCRGCSSYSACILPQARSLRGNPGYKPGSSQDGKPE